MVVVDDRALRNLVFIVACVEAAGLDAKYRLGAGRGYVRRRVVSFYRFSIFPSGSSKESRGCGA